MRRTMTHLLTHRLFGLMLASAIAAGWTTSAAATEPGHNLRPATLEIACELESATDAMRDELKVHLRRVRGYGVLLGTNAQLHARASAIRRRFERNPGYRGLDRDVEKVEDLAIRVAQRLQEIVNCPEHLERACGDVRHVVARANQLLDLTEALRASVIRYCERGDFAPQHLANEYRPQYLYPAERGFGNHQAHPPLTRPRRGESRSGYNAPLDVPFGAERLPEVPIFQGQGAGNAPVFQDPGFPASPPLPTLVPPNVEAAPGPIAPPANSWSPTLVPSRPIIPLDSGANQAPELRLTPELIAPEPTLGPAARFKPTSSSKPSLLKSVLTNSPDRWERQ